MRGLILGVLAIGSAISVLGGVILCVSAALPWMSYNPAGVAHHAAVMDAIRSGLPMPTRPPIEWITLSIGGGMVVHGAVLGALAMIFAMVLDLHATWEKTRPQPEQPKKREGFLPYLNDPEWDETKRMLRRQANSN